MFFHNKKEMGEEREKRLATKLTAMRLAEISAGLLMLRGGKYIAKSISPCVISKQQCMEVYLVELLGRVILSKKENISQLANPYLLSMHACSV